MEMNGLGWGLQDQNGLLFQVIKGDSLALLCLVKWWSWPSCACPQVQLRGVEAGLGDMAMLTARAPDLKTRLTVHRAPRLRQSTMAQGCPLPPGFLPAQSQGGELIGAGSMAKVICCGARGREGLGAGAGPQGPRSVCLPHAWRRGWKKLESYLGRPT